MLRMMICAAALLTPGFAAAEEFPHSAQGIEIRSDQGEVMGRVERVERNAQGRVMAVQASGLEAPEDAPAASSDLVAEAEPRHMAAGFFIRESAGRGGGVDFRETRTR